MIMPIEALLAAIPNVSSARGALERIQQFSLDLPVEMARATTPLHAVDSIVLDGGTHQYFREKENEVFT
ncbi:cyclic peptide export ABC transporter, partial [Burkholderia sp. SIMBA_019]